MASTNMILVVLFVLGVFASSVSSSRLLNTQPSMRERHEQWMSEYGRVYKSDVEKEARFQVFKDNVEHIEAMNKLNRGFTLGLNAFTDMTSEEFRATHNGYKKHMKPASSMKLTPFKYENLRDAPASIDWRTLGAVTPIKDQGQCAIAPTEGIIQIKTRNLTSLSEQEIVDCDVNDMGCGGGTMDGAFSFIMSNGGITTESNYPYVESQGTCNTKAGPVAPKLSSYQDVPSNSESALLNVVANQPVSVAIDASGSDFQFYSEGVFNGNCDINLDHAVTIIGYDTTSNGTDYWIVKNSWGASWGEQGYIRMQRGLNSPQGLCGINMEASYPNSTKREHNTSSMAAKIYIVYYSMYGHVEKLAEEIKKGAASVEGVEVKLWQVPETLPEEVLLKMSAPPKSDVPLITPNELAEADGLLFGFPTRFGMMAAQFKAFLDATGGLWRTQQLAGKPAGIFYATGSQGGGQETTPLTAITQLAHHGLIYVPIGYTFGAGMFEMEKVKGGTPYGAGTFAGDGSRQPSELELQQAFHQGKYFAAIAKKLKGTT
ncbi:putative NAD(P)H dehydrogenase (quinone) FQR1-like 1 [Drosera capensis]